jgi:hypothetical protein
MQIRVPASDNYTSAKQIANFASIIFSINILRVRSETLQMWVSAH